MSQPVTAFFDYREYIKARIADAEANWGLISKMASAARCQRSQLSRVLSGHLHLTLDQAYGLVEFWQLSDLESSCFVKMVELARATHPAYRARLEKEISGIRTAQDNLARRLQQPALPLSEVEALYYSSWHWTALHILVSIPEFQTSKLIAERLVLPLKMVEECLKRLEEYNLVRKSGARWSFTSTTTHLPKSSPFISIHHANWRQRAVLDSQSGESEGVHYTMVQSLSRSDFERIKQMILGFVEDYNRVAAPSREEELVCFTCDLFRV